MTSVLDIWRAQQNVQLREERLENESKELAHHEQTKSGQQISKRRESLPPPYRYAENLDKGSTIKDQTPPRPKRKPPRPPS